MRKKFSELLLVSDFDGTLYDDGTIPQKNLDAIEYFIDNGGTFTICTGRSKQSLGQRMGEFPYNAPPVVCNGAMIYDYKKNELVDCTYLGENVRAVLHKIMEEFPGLGIEGYSVDHMYVLQDNPVVHRHSMYESIDYRILPMEDVKEELVKIILTDEPDNIPPVLDFIADMAPDLEYSRTAPIFLELFHKNVDKGYGLQRLTENLGFDMKNTYAVGDYYNDIGLLRTARHSYAVEGAPAELLEVSDAVVCDASEGAVAAAIALIDQAHSN